mmetsp:Transcript_20728/g.50571  ORF Transcript_20728/g.50571 Transcript_20728/m.50571 type:complete len:97 (+) Transcript_20728:678-968(+)
MRWVSLRVHRAKATGRQTDRQIQKDHRSLAGCLAACTLATRNSLPSLLSLPDSIIHSSCDGSTGRALFAFRTSLSLMDGWMDEWVRALVCKRGRNV